MTDQGAYDIEDDDDDGDAPKPAAPAPARRVPAPPAKAARASSAPAVDSGDEDDDGDDSLPPPIARETDPKLWWIVAGASIALLLVSYLAGARALAPIEIASDGSTVIRELGFGSRLAGFARVVVFAPLAGLSVLFGVACVAFLEQRPFGHAPSLVARCAAIAAIGMLTWLAPVEIRFLKNSINALGPPLVAGLLSMPLFRLAPREAGLVTAFSVIGLLLLTLFAHVIVWAVAG